MRSEWGDRGHPRKGFSTTALLSSIVLVTVDCHGEARVACSAFCDVGKRHCQPFVCRGGVYPRIEPGRVSSCTTAPDVRDQILNVLTAWRLFNVTQKAIACILSQIIYLVSVRLAAKCLQTSSLDPTGQRNLIDMSSASTAQSARARKPRGPLRELIPRNRSDTRIDVAVCFFLFIAICLTLPYNAVFAMSAPLTIEVSSTIPRFL